jgi:alpha-mannosidase
VPGLGYGRWLLRERARSEVAVQTEVEPARDAPRGAARQSGFVHACRYAIYERGAEGLENEHLRLELDPRGGGIGRLVHVPTGTVVVDGAASILEHAVERPRPMSAWEIEHAGASTAPVVTKIERGAAGPFVASIAVDMRVGASQARLVYELRAGDPRLHLKLSVTWLERGGPDVGTPVLRLVLPLAVAGEEARPRAVYEIPFGAIERSLPFGEEVPALRWAAVEAGAGARQVTCLLFNDCKHGHSFHRGRLALTLIRSSFAPDPLPEIGQHEVRCALACAAGPLDPAAAAVAAAAFERELLVVSTSSHGGSLPASAALLSVEGAVLSGLKAAEEGGGIVARVYNPGEREVEARVAPAGPLGAVRDAEEVDLLERRLSQARVEGAAAVVRVPPRGIRTLRIRLA